VQLLKFAHGLFAADSRSYEFVAYVPQLNANTLALDSYFKYLLALQPLPVIILAFLESDVWRRAVYIDIQRRPDGSATFEQVGGDYAHTKGIGTLM
jgi:hypothetical protein